MSSRPISRRLLGCSGITLFSIVMGFAMITSAGCSGGSNPAPVSSTSVEPAKAAVAAFLDAVKRGDDGAARGMLTKIAAAKTKEMGISVAPPVPASATYSIRECELVGDSEGISMGDEPVKRFSDGLRKQKYTITKVMEKKNGWYIFYAESPTHRVIWKEGPIKGNHFVTVPMIVKK